MMSGGGMEMFAALMMMGVRVREVWRLSEGSVWLPSRNLLLIDSELTKTERECVSRRFTLSSRSVD